jgi:hypothetical protein
MLVVTRISNLNERRYIVSRDFRWYHDIIYTGWLGCCLTRAVVSHDSEGSDCH